MKNKKDHDYSFIYFMVSEFLLGLICGMSLCALLMNYLGYLG